MVLTANSKKKEYLRRRFGERSSVWAAMLTKVNCVGKKMRFTGSRSLQYARCLSGLRPAEAHEWWAKGHGFNYHRY